MIPSVGRIVHYRLTEEDAKKINKRRADAKASGIAATDSGAIVHHGNLVDAGETLPLIITRVGDAAEGLVNGQVLLDGNDHLWVLGCPRGDNRGQWHEPPRVDSAGTTRVDVEQALKVAHMTAHALAEDLERLRAKV